MEQLDLFGTATAITTQTTPAPPADTQLSLFRPDFTAMRTPAPRGKKPAPPVLDPALHDGTLI